MAREFSLILAILVGIPSIQQPGARAADGKLPLAEAFLTTGKLSEGETSLATALKANPKDDQARFGLGVVQFMHAVERRMQAFHRYGFRTDIAGRGNPITNLPVPFNANPEALDASKARSLLQSWVEELKTVESTLAGITDPEVKLPLHFGLIKLDFNEDGRFAEDEILWKIYSRYNPSATPNAEAAAAFVIAFDRGDVDWLRGYCHLLSAVSETLLAYDFGPVLDEFGFYLFSGMKPKHTYQEVRDVRTFEIGTILDAVALIHAIRLPLADANRLKSALAHLESTSALSRSSWKSIQAETDDDQEWIPNSRQHSVVPNAQVTPEMIQGWFTFLDEFEAILAGKKLLPFWRGKDPAMGVNLRKMFTEPKPLDLIRWVQGPGVEAFLERGEVTSARVWGRLNQIFHGNFVGFAIWFN